MGMSNSQLFLSQKDLNDMEFNFLSKPMSEIQDHRCQISDSVGDNQNQETEQQKEEREEQRGENDSNEVTSSKIIIKRPSLGELKEDENEDGFRTPTSLDQRIPLIPKCPQAPRKSKAVSRKRKVESRRRILIDLSTEIESFFSPAIVAAGGDHGGKIKKFRREN